MLHERAGQRFVRSRRSRAAGARRRVPRYSPQEGAVSMSRQFGLLLASTLVAGLIAACSAPADPGGQLNGHAAGYGSGPGSGSAGDNTNGDTPGAPEVDAGSTPN